MTVHWNLKHSWLKHQETVPHYGYTRKIEMLWRSQYCSLQSLDSNRKSQVRLCRGFLRARSRHFRFEISDAVWSLIRQAQVTAGRSPMMRGHSYWFLCSKRNRSGLVVDDKARKRQKSCMRRFPLNKATYRIADWLRRTKPMTQVFPVQLSVAIHSIDLCSKSFLKVYHLFERIESKDWITLFVLKCQRSALPILQSFGHLAPSLIEVEQVLVVLRMVDVFTPVVSLLMLVPSLKHNEQDQEGEPYLTWPSRNEWTPLFKWTCHAILCLLLA